MVYKHDKTNDRKRKRSTQSEDSDEKLFVQALDLPQSSRHNQPRDTLNIENMHETPTDFLNRTGRNTLFRAIRIIATDKREPTTENQIVVPPDGDLFVKLKDKHLDRAAEYRKLTEWPKDAPIKATAPTANTPIAQHVSGDNILSPYISTGNKEGAVQNTVKNWNGAGPASERRNRPEKNWSPIVEIDVRKLPDTTKIFDLTKPNNTFFNAMESNIAENAFGDKEVLISPEIPGSAIIRVINNPEEIKQIAGLNPSVPGKKTIPEEKIIFEEKKTVSLYNSADISLESPVFKKRKKPINVRTRTDS
ncbi:DUF7587 domain-containing protein [Photorhabdus bodei]|uniref:DUF7587 domain-containing protein n=1 Tax=Photorhabdus bodei TaxID=2029681 RepID=A0A329X8X5_9GAMM|nr:hypothetical protein [Photorhabdus bodei]NDK99546.1 hypothetical protein [Photorhabdus bodei]NDL03874.1 hypothetical protein [Photorhabdus bodei]NDL07925.1 hypothetical protein [Photorhabdus bodei]RAX13254.1 hypothetical protein CKY02_07025 [Photorhabdus bodei]